MDKDIKRMENVEELKKNEEQIEEFEHQIRQLKRKNNTIRQQLNPITRGWYLCPNEEDKFNDILCYVRKIHKKKKRSTCIRVSMITQLEICCDSHPLVFIQEDDKIKCIREGTKEVFCFFVDEVSLNNLVPITDLQILLKYNVSADSLLRILLDEKRVFDHAIRDGSQLKMVMGYLNSNLGDVW